ncbi:MAG: DNA-binding protein [Gemmatimonadetes bacterium]|nr:DNA-binding protein [Gemmatimonadota bacterium]
METPLQLDESLAGVPTERRELIEVFLERVWPFLVSSLTTSSSSLLRSVLAAPTHAGTLARFLSEVASDEAVAALDPLAAAFARAGDIQETLLKKAGGTWLAGEVAEHLAITRQAVDKRRKRGSLLAVEVRSWHRYPLCQFSEGGVVDGLPEVLKAIDTDSGWTRLSVLLSPTLRSDSADDADMESSVLDALRQGHKAEALHAAASWGRHEAV